jgi:hypothetical protein
MTKTVIRKLKKRDPRAETCDTPDSTGNELRSYDTDEGKFCDT